VAVSRTEVREANIVEPLDLMVDPTIGTTP
jgi:hypothetical protein